MTRRVGEDQQGSDRALVETVATTLITGAPAEWQSLHSTFDIASIPPLATAVATLPDGRAHTVPVPARALDLVINHQRRSESSTALWRSLTIDVSSDGRLAAATDLGPVSATAAFPHGRLRPLIIGLAVLTTGCLLASAVLFTFFWRWQPPPRADVIPVPPPPPRQQEAYTVAVQWFEAENERDVAKMRALACTEPAQSVTDWINTIDLYGQDQGLDFPDAVSQFQDNGTTVRIQIAVRIRPLDDRTRKRVEDAQANGGFLYEGLTLADEGGRLKVCDVE